MRRSRPRRRNSPSARSSRSGRPELLRRRRLLMSPSAQAALLGVVQGATEFLPVSSTAHLILARAWFGFDADKFGLAFDVACHLGTLIAVLIYFRAELARMIRAIPDLAAPARNEEARLIWLLAIATIPAVIVGALFKHVIEDRLRTVLVCAVALAVGGVLLAVADHVGSKTRTERSLGIGDALWIGCAQAVALIPGVSRSGATITAALLLGMARQEAARFIFLLSIPAILGAAVSEAPAILKAGVQGDERTLFVIGVVTSAIVGYVAVSSFIRFLGRHSLDVFAWYRVALAGVAAIWLLAQ